jgi:Uma2 family endonuclease
MAVPQPSVQPYTLADFAGWIERPEHAGRRFELIDGEIVEGPSNPYSSWIVQNMLAAIVVYLQQHPVGYVTGEAAGYQNGEQVLSPDGAFVTSLPMRQGFSTELPKLVIEIISPTDRSADVMLKLRKYLAAGVTFWVVYPEQKTVDVWVPGQPVISLGADEALSAPDILPGFSLSVRSVVED